VLAGEIRYLTGKFPEVEAGIAAEAEAAVPLEADAAIDVAKPSVRQKKPKYFHFAPIDRLERERVLHDEKYTDGSRDELTFVHIGKCGGYSVAHALAISPQIQSRFTRISRVHLRPPHYQSNASYLFVLRNPIDRLISAFAWRYQKVVQERELEFQYPGEFEALVKYETLNNLAEVLVRDGRLSNEAMRSMLSITHFRHDIAYYLEGLLTNISPEQVYCVFTQDQLTEDMERVLGVDGISRQNKSDDTLFEKNMALSTVARENLKLVFFRDYDCIRSLNAIYPLGAEKLEALLQ
jgi:hypothetical protein